MHINYIKFPRGSLEPAQCLLLLVSSPLLSSPVCLPSCTAERRGPNGGEAGPYAMNSGKASLPVHL